MRLKLRDYQANTVKSLAISLKENSKVLTVLPTGAGKSIVIGFIANKLKGRTLILTHRTEILKQNSAWLHNVGMLTSTENTVSLSNKVVIAMVQTLHARIKKHGIGYIGDFDNIIIDEAHIDIFHKVYRLYCFKRLIGFTATPVTNKKSTVVIDEVDFVKTHSLKEYYDDLIVGTSEQELIMEGYLVREKAYTLELPNMDQLQSSTFAPDGYTSQSLTKVYSNTASMKILKEAYLKYCKGKKTLIFNATTKVNIPVANLFKSMGCKVKNFDSVNSDSRDRQDIIDWFKKERDAVLIGTNVFTTGFDVDDIEVVIVNRATKSLSLWIQMCGRGSRPTKKIKKNEFILLDLGQNIEEHGLWSKERDWNDLFHDPEMRRKNKTDVTLIWECPECGAYNPNGELITDAGIVCPVCKALRVVPKVKRPDKTGQIVEVTRTLYPKSKKIIDYTIAQDGNSSFAFKILERRILDVFKQHSVSSEYYSKRRDEFHERVRRMMIPCYFAIIRHKGDMKQGAHKKLDKQLQKMYKIVDKHYKWKPQ